MIKEKEVLEEMKRHSQALEAISNGTTPEQKVSKEDAFIKEMQEMNKTSSNGSKQENEFFNYLEEEK